jgi:hypothetical protein
MLEKHIVDLSTCSDCRRTNQRPRADGRAARLRESTDARSCD